MFCCFSATTWNSSSRVNLTLGVIVFTCQTCVRGGERVALSRDSIPYVKKGNKLV
jgi:hypothetical protein